MRLLGILLFTAGFIAIVAGGAMGTSWIRYLGVVLLAFGVPLITKSFAKP